METVQNITVNDICKSNTDRIDIVLTIKPKDKSNIPAELLNNDFLSENGYVFVYIWIFIDYKKRQICLSQFKNHLSSFFITSNNQQIIDIQNQFKGLSTKLLFQLLKDYKYLFADKTDYFYLELDQNIGDIDLLCAFYNRTLGMKKVCCDCGTYVDLNDNCTLCKTSCTFDDPVMKTDIIDLLRLL